MNERRDWAPVDWSPMKRLIYLRGNGATGGGGSPLTVTGATPLLMPGAVSKPMRAASFAISPVQAGSGDPSPSNMRPITGWTAANVTVTGKNLYPHGIIVEYTYEWYSGSKNLSDAQYPFFLKGGTSYVLSYENSNDNAKPMLRVWRKDGTILEDEPSVLNAKMLTSADAYKYAYSSGPMYYTGVISSNDNAMLIAPTEDIWIDARIQSPNGTSSNVMLTPGTTPSPYTPYSGSSLSVEFPASVGTVYSGTIDPVTGEGVVTHKCVTFDGTENWTSSGSGSGVFYTPLNDMAKLLDYRNEMFCDSLLVTKGNATASFNTAAFTITGYRDTADYYKNQNWIYAKATDITTVAEMVQFLQEHPAQVVYPLATPIPFTVTPQTLTPPAGDAYIWADCGSTAEVTYIGKA